jgi:hypothetical protein
MAAITFTDCTVYDSTLSSGVKELIVVTPATADNSDTIAIVMKSFGIKSILSIFVNAHDTEDSIVTTEAPTTSVTTGTLTVTLGAVAGSNKKRVITIRGLC